MSRLSHIDSKGQARMVDVSEKPPTAREAVACGTVLMRPETLALLKENRVAKGDVLQVARVAGIMAAKKTPDIIPLCHPLSITSVSVDFTVDEEKSRVLIESRVKTVGQTGVEMEALTAVAAAALTVYDMCKAVDREMTITGIMLLEKRGGRSGEFRREKD
ncbi:Cyclic pyranopterin monophosphate synthase accessory protein [hydrothermal vent metagenome]|uniref:cyclic pyranopterin monophosphate synthase n=1 Tax=hydrothermal vent metagenome TaxID=652676 RepID=A0A3B1CT82_9ZZZZ